MSHKLLLMDAALLALHGHTPAGGHCHAGGATSVAAGRLSYAFGLRGPAVSIDTACSSSLVGAHYAAADICAGTVARALAAGVNLTLSPAKTAAFTITGVFRSSARFLLRCEGASASSEPMGHTSRTKVAPEQCQVLPYCTTAV